MEVRKLELPRDAVLPRHWFFGSPVHTSLLDALCLLFPDGEKFFIRSVRHYLDRIDDPKLLADVKAFAAQESWHGRAHLQVADLLAAQGFDARAVLDRFAHLGFEVIEPRFPPHIRLSVTAAAEHFTAALAEIALGTPVLEGAASPMRDLLRWHAVEELEHRAVAFDVLRHVDPRWRTRAIGMALATGLIVTCWMLNFRALRRQAERLPAAGSPGSVVPPSPRLRERSPLRALTHVGRAIADYLRPGFHPSQRRLPDEFARWREGSPGILNTVQNRTNTGGEAA